MGKRAGACSLIHRLRSASTERLVLNSAEIGSQFPAPCFATSSFRFASSAAVHSMITRPNESGPFDHPPPCFSSFVHRCRSASEDLDDAKSALTACQFPTPCFVTSSRSCASSSADHAPPATAPASATPTSPSDFWATPNCPERAAASAVSCLFCHRCRSAPVDLFPTRTFQLFMRK